MSADNYFLIREADGRFLVTMEFASSEPPSLEQQKARPLARWFDTKEQAFNYADGEYTEYGVRFYRVVVPPFTPEETNAALAVLSKEDRDIFESSRALIGIWNEEGQPTLMGIIVKLAARVKALEAGGKS